MKYGKSYSSQEGRPWLVPGQVVLVQPGTMTKRPYLCIITERVQNWVGGDAIELCTMIPWKHGAVIWPYWVGRISKANTAQCIWFYVKWFFRGTKKTNIEVTRIADMP
jgi:hypothetical protein